MTHMKILIDTLTSWQRFFIIKKNIINEARFQRKIMFFYKNIWKEYKNINLNVSFNVKKCTNLNIVLNIEMELIIS